MEHKVLTISKSHKNLEPISYSEEHYWALFYMALYKFLHNLHTVLVQTANEWDYKKNAYNTLPLDSDLNNSVTTQSNIWNVEK
jgi:hypothetical protein